MSMKSTLTLAGMIRTINKNIIASFLIMLVCFVVLISGAFINYQNNEKKLIAQKLQTTFEVFTSRVSQKLLSIAVLEEFGDYFHSGWISRGHHYTSLLTKMFKADLKVVAGMDIYKIGGESIFSYGEKTTDFVILDLCYLNKRFPEFDTDICQYAWKLYFKREAMLAGLKKLNPELVECDDCVNEIITGKYFGDFPIVQFSNMKVGLGIRKHPSTVLWEVYFFIVGALLVLVMWNINRIKTVFKKYLSDPILEITYKIRVNERLSPVAIKELSYLIEQIDLWKTQVIELEKIKAQEKTKEEKVKMMQVVGASIAHELRTPLRSIVSGVSGIEKFLPALLKGYDLAREAGLPVEMVRPHQLELLNKVLYNLKAEGVSANTIIDMLLIKIRGNITETSSIKNLSIAECLKEALQRYVFQGSEKGLVFCDMNNDFYFAGDKILVVHILFNLFKNALYYIARAQKGKIYIRLEKRENENLLYFKDTGKGIASDVLPHIFDRFYSKTEGGVGIGLSFCKMTMEWMGGDIICRSIENEYTEFILHFPIPNSEE